WVPTKIRIQNVLYIYPYMLHICTCTYVLGAVQQVSTAWFVPFGTTYCTVCTVPQTYLVLVDVYPPPVLYDPTLKLCKMTPHAPSLARYLGILGHTAYAFHTQTSVGRLGMDTIHGCNKHNRTAQCVQPRDCNRPAASIDTGLDISPEYPYV